MRWLICVCVDKLDARQPLDFSLLRISPEFLIDQNRYLPFLSIFHKLVSNLSETGYNLVVHELELTIN